MSCAVFFPDVIGDDAVAHAECGFVGKNMGRHMDAVENSGHDDKRSVAAFHTGVKEGGGVAEERFEIRVSHVLHDSFIIGGTFRLIAIGTVLFLAMGQIAAADHGNPAVQLIRSFPDVLPQPVMHR